MTPTGSQDHFEKGLIRTQTIESITDAGFNKGSRIRWAVSPDLSPWDLFINQTHLS